MNIKSEICKSVEQAIDENPKDLSAEFELHTSICKECEKYKENHINYLNFIGSTPEPELSLIKQEHMIRLAIEKDKELKQGKYSWQSFAGGFVAASVIAFTVLVFGGWNLNNLSNNPSFTQENMAFTQMDETDLLVVLNVPDDIPGATLSIDLPDEVAVIGLEHLQKVEWNIDLKKGVNTISLPLDIAPYVESIDQLELVASLKMGNKTKEFILKLNSQLENQSSLLFDSEYLINQA